MKGIQPVKNKPAPAIPEDSLRYSRIDLTCSDLRKNRLVK